MTNPGPIEKLEKRVDELCRRLRNKVPWVGAGVVVAVGSIIAMLTYNAYSGAQEKQCKDIAENTVAVHELKTNGKVIGIQLEHIKDELQELKEGQEDQFEKLMHKLDEHLGYKKGGEPK